MPEGTITLADAAAGNVGFVLAQAVLDALIRRGLLRVDDVAPMLDEVVALWRAPPAEPARAQINESMANVLEAILQRHRGAPGAGG